MRAAKVSLKEVLEKVWYMHAEDQKIVLSISTTATDVNTADYKGVLHLE